MRLEGNYYELTSMETDGMSGVFHIRLCQDCQVYRGHFPGNPVCPGVCNMQTIKECAERLIGRRVQISQIRQCRLMAVATPDGCPELEVKVKLSLAETGCTIVASIADAERIYMDLKGELTV